MNNKERCKKWYRKNKKEVLIKQARRYQNIKEERRLKYLEFKKFIDTYKQEKGCIVCGEKDPVVLELHHIDPIQKEVSIAQMATYSKEKQELEIKKCVVICSNDHRRVTKGTIKLDKYITKEMR